MIAMWRAAKYGATARKSASSKYSAQAAFSTFRSGAPTSSRRFASPAGFSARMSPLTGNGSAPAKSHGMHRPAKAPAPSITPPRRAAIGAWRTGSTTYWTFPQGHSILIAWNSAIIENTQDNISKSSVFIDADVLGCINMRHQTTFNALYSAPDEPCGCRNSHMHINEIFVSNDPGRFHARGRQPRPQEPDHPVHPAQLRPQHPAV